MQTPHALKSQTNFVSFMYFPLNSTTDKQIPFALLKVTKKLLKKGSWTWTHANEMQGRMGNITVLFSHCVKKGWYGYFLEPHNGCIINNLTSILMQTFFEGQS